MLLASGWRQRPTEVVNPILRSAGRFLNWRQPSVQASIFLLWRARQVSGDRPPSSNRFQTGTPADVIERAQYLCAEARTVVAHARQAISEGRTQRNRAAPMARRSRECSTRPADHMLVRCAYCDRVRTPQGEWVAYPTRLSWGRNVEVSHGFCRDCLAQHFPQWPSLSVPDPAALLPC